MEIKVSDYIANFFAEHGITTIFTVVGGGSMHMNDSFGHHEKIQCIYNHHEQASSIAAEAYFRINNKMAGLCVTSGPGAINALNGVVGAYQDSIPMIVVSGQVKTSLMTRASGLDLRTLGNQEFDICSALSKVAKYYTTIINKEDVRYCLEKAFYQAKAGRPGPCWLDIPLDIQGALINPIELRGYNPNSEGESFYGDDKELLKKKILILENKVKESKRPVIYAGNGIRISGGHNIFLELANKLQIPIVTCWNSIDLIETDNPLYVGRAGIMGDRAGNWAVQNSDLVLAIGTRLNIYQVGYQIKSWAREAYIVVVDIDELELQKKTIRVDLPIWADAKEFMESFYKLSQGTDKKFFFADWRKTCKRWKENYPVVEKKHYCDENPLNVYAFIDSLSKMLPEGMNTVVANGSASVVGSATYHIKKNQRFIMNCALSSMGYDLPAAIGACIAGNRKSIVCLAGDGSIMMNLQELQTIVTNKLPIKIIVINNDGYQQIRITQTNLFNKNYVGIGPQTGDLGFPDFGKLAWAFGIPYKRCEELASMKDSIKWILSETGVCLLEVFCTTEQFFEPKSAVKKLKDGTLYSPPLEDLAPFLSREELKRNMIIEMWDETSYEKSRLN